MTDAWTDEQHDPDEPLEATAGSTTTAMAGADRGPEPMAARARETAPETAPEMAVEAVSNSRQDPAVDPGVDPDLRVAHVLLRMGSPLAARANLETLAGANRLDRQGLLDLAESRWRTGDLPGAGEATVAYLEHGGVAALAYLIAAEATAATGRPGEAGRYARRALDGLTLPLDAVFAGQPRSPIWPNDPADPGQQAGTLFAEPASDASRGGRIGLTSVPRATVDASPGPARGPTGGVGVMAEPLLTDLSSKSREGRPDRSLWDEPDPVHEAGAMVPAAQGASLPDVGSELDGARDDLAAGDHRAAAVRLGVVLRLRPALAPAVLDAIGDLPGPDFDLLRGDALRLVGHEAAAQRAFASAANALSEPPDTRSNE